MTHNDRLEAFSILKRVFINKSSLTPLLHSRTALTKALCFGVCRHYYRLQAVLNHLMDKAPKEVEISIILALGIYQLQFLMKPEYATVKETVALLDKLKKPWAKGLANAVLRRFCRERQAILAALESDEAFSFAHPTWFCERLKRDWPQDWLSILKANDAHPPMSLRVNLRQGSREHYLACLKDANLQATLHQQSLSGLTLTSACDVAELPGFADGVVSVQDEAAQLAVTLLELKPGQRILDVCAAPGGKTCHILEACPALLDCVAVDIDAQRLQRVQENLSRLKLKATLKQGDALQPSTWWDGQYFDRILLDAPCSATGVIRRHPDIKVLRNEENIAKIVQLQAQILAAVWPLLKRGGLLVYATCSVLKAENEEQMSNFLETNPDATCLQGNKPWGETCRHGWQILPGRNGCDGFFYCVLSKVNLAGC